MNYFVSGRGEGRGRGPHKMKVFGITRIRFIWFGLNLAWSMDILLGPKNKAAEEFFVFFSKSKMATGVQSSKISHSWPHKSHFGSTFGSGWSDLDNIWHGHTSYLTLETSPQKKFSFFSKYKMAVGGQRTEIVQIWPHKSHFGSSFESGSSDLDNIWHGHTTWP